MTDTDFDAVKTLLATPSNVVITTHQSPDGDAIGSSLAVYHYLTQKGHHVHVITPNNYPDFLKWLPGNETVLRFDDHREDAMPLLEGADIIFCLDYNSLGRLGELENAVRASVAVKILIDHHQDPENSFDYALHDINACSTAELVYGFIEQLGDKDLINQDVAMAIYTGIMTDTGSFRFSSTTARTHTITADLIVKGADVEQAHGNVYDSNSEGRLHLLGFCLREKLQVFKEYRTALISLSLDELKQHNYRIGDTEDVVNYGLSVEGVRMAALIMERKNEVKISMRSKGDFPVNELAKAHFSGGGHINAAGGSSNSSLEETIEKFIGLLPQYKEQLNG